MSIELFSRIDFGIKLEEKTSRYPITVKLQMTEDDEAKFEAFKEGVEKEYEEINAASTRSAKLKKEMQRLIEDEEDVTAEIEAEDASDEERSALIKERRSIRKKRRAMEDELEDIIASHGQEVFMDSAKKITEAVAEKSFMIHVKDDDKREALVSAIKQHGLPYTVIVSELNRLIQAAKKKK